MIERCMRIARPRARLGAVVRLNTDLTVVALLERFKIAQDWRRRQEACRFRRAGSGIDVRGGCRGPRRGRKMERSKARFAPWRLPGWPPAGSSAATALRSATVCPTGCWLVPRGGGSEIFEEVGHYPHGEAPERLLGVLLDFIDSTARVRVWEREWRRLFQSPQE